jgi:hypothetical protein
MSVHTDANSRSHHEAVDKDAELQKERAQSMVSDKQERLLGKGQLPSITK